MAHFIGKRARQTRDMDENSVVNKIASVRQLPMVPTNNDLEVGSLYYIVTPIKLFLGRFSELVGARLRFTSVTQYFPNNRERQYVGKLFIARNPTNIYKINRIEWPNRFTDTLFDSDSTSNGSREYSSSSSSGTKRRRASRRARSARASAF